MGASILVVCTTGVSTVSPASGMDRMIIQFSQQICNVNLNFDLWTTGIRCPHVSMCIDNPHMHENIHVLSQKVLREISELF